MYSPYYSYCDSPPVSPAESTTSEDSECSHNTSSTSSVASGFVNRKPRFPTKYHEMLQPLSPVTTHEPAWQPELHHAGTVDSGLQAEFFTLVRDSSPEDIEAFLRHHEDRVNVNAFEEELGQTALQEACQLGRIEVAQVLVRHGASARLANRCGFTLMHLAAFSGNPKMLAYVSSLNK